MKNFILKEVDGHKILEMEENGIISFVPLDEANSDYQAYLNETTLASELSNPSTPQAGE